MIFVDVKKASGHPVSVKRIKDAVKKTLVEQGIVSDSEVSVAIVGKEKMAQLVEEYYDDEGKGSAHPVLAFPVLEMKSGFVFPPDGKNHLGEIVVSYPSAVDAAKRDNKLVEDVVIALVQHGVLHLVGIHHD